MIKNVLHTILVSLLFFACQNNSETDFKTREALKKNITELEDSIARVQKNSKSVKSLTNLTSIDLINRLTACYRAFPKDEYAADCLFKIHMKFSELNAQEKAIAYGDTLLQSFPNYKNKGFLLESMGSTYDVLIQPRDTSKIRYYYSLLLKEKKLTKEKREGIVNRLKHIELDFFSYVNLNSKEVSR